MLRSRSPLRPSSSDAESLKIIVKGPQARPIMSHHEAGKGFNYIETRKNGTTL